MARGFRVALVRPEYTGDFDEPCEPLGPLLLAAALRRWGIEAEVFDFQLPVQGEFSRLVSFEPELLALSLMSEENVRPAQKLILTMRERFPRHVCEVGGLYVTTCGEQAAARFPAGTVLLPGEGESSLPRLCFDLMGKGFPAEVPDILTPDDWPFAARDRLEEYRRWGAPVSVRTSRGCRGGCAFCATPGLPQGLGRWAGRSIANLVDEMEQLSQLTIPVFNFVDDDFGPLERVEQLAAELSRRGLRTAFSLQLRAAALYEREDLSAVLPMLKAAGLCRVFVGIESLSEATLRSWNKNLNPQRAVEAVLAIKNAGIAAHTGYILWHPGSTQQSVREEAAALFNAGLFTTKTAVSRLVLFPGCALYRRASARGGAVWAPIPDELDYHRVAAVIAPLYRAWIPGATALPRFLCLAHLGDCSAKLAADRIDGALTALDALSYQILMNPDAVSQAEINETAIWAGGELRASGCSGFGRV